MDLSAYMEFNPTTHHWEKDRALNNQQEAVMRSLLVRVITQAPDLREMVAYLVNPGTCRGLVCHTSNVQDDLWFIEWWNFGCFRERLEKLPALEALSVVELLLGMAECLDIFSDEMGWNPTAFFELMDRLIPEVRVDLHTMLQQQIQKLRDSSAWSTHNRDTLAAYLGGIKAVLSRNSEAKAA
jgi:hypothetical protein